MVLSYRHAFHVGNHADVVKHSIISLLVTTLAGKKEKPLFLLDTHAAPGLYDLLTHPYTLQTQEYTTGISKLFSRQEFPRALFPYLYSVRACNNLYPAATTQQAQQQPKHNRRITAETEKGKHIHSHSHSHPHPYPGHHSHHQHYCDDDLSDDVLTTFSLPHVVPEYLSLSSTPLRFYPGSPALLRQLCRKGDRIYAYEKLEADHRQLEEYFQTPRPSPAYPYYPVFPYHENRRPGLRDHAVCGDGFHASKLLPPQERRGVVIVDPAYEEDIEWDRVEYFIRAAVKRWATGVYAVWYPLIVGKQDDADRLVDCTRSMPNIHKMLHVKFDMQMYLQDLLPASTAIDNDSATPSTDSDTARTPKRTSLYGCGMLIINPPYLLDTVLSASVLPFLSSVLTDGIENRRAEWTVEWLLAEKQAVHTTDAVTGTPLDPPETHAHT